MKKKLRIMNHQIDQLKEEISAKEAALVKEQLEHMRVDKEKEALKAELQRMKQQAAESKVRVAGLSWDRWYTGWGKGGGIITFTMPRS